MELDEPLESVNEEIRKQAVIFIKPKSDFDHKVNEASVYLSMKNHSLLRKGNRGEVMEAACKKKLSKKGMFLRKVEHDRNYIECQTILNKSV